MPDDANGQLVKVGEEVLVRFKVKEVLTSENYCNVNLESILGMPPDGHKTTLSAINTKQVEVVKGSSDRTIAKESYRYKSPIKEVKRRKAVAHVAL